MSSTWKASVSWKAQNKDTKIGMLPGQVLLLGCHMWDVASYGDTFHRPRVSGMKAKITPHCANYLSVLSTFIKSSNIIPVLDTDCRCSAWKQYFLHFNYRWSWPDGAVWAAVSFPDQRWKQSLKFAQTYWHILLFSLSTERASQTQ